MRKDWERDKNVVSAVWNSGYKRYDLSIDDIIQKIKEAGYSLEKEEYYEDDLDPDDNYILEIHSEKGTVITSDVELILKPRIYKNGIDITERMDMKYFKWVRTSSDPQADAEWNLIHSTGIKNLEVTSEDVRMRAIFHCAFLTGAAETNFVANMYAAYMSSINNNKGA